MKRLFKILFFVSLVTNVFGQAKPVYERSRTDQVLSDRATWSKVFLGIPSGPAIIKPVYAPDSAARAWLFYRVLGGDSALYVAGKRVTGDTTGLSNRIDSKLSKAGGTVTGDVILPNTIPTNALQAINKSYVDNAVTGLAWKPAVRVKTTANITLSGTQTIDGVALAVGNRVLVEKQTDGKLNGIYVVASSAWTRADDADTGSELLTSTVMVTAGTAYKNTQWTNTNTLTPTIGTDAISYAQISGAGTYAPGTGMTLVANVFSFDKTYTDAYYLQIANVSNGLTGSTTSLKLGGFLTANTTISGGTYNLTLGNNNTSLNFDNTNREATLKSFASNNDWAAFTGTGSTILMQTTNAANGAFKRIRIDRGGTMQVYDQENSKGLENTGDYESNFTARSLVTKQFVSNGYFPITAGSVNPLIGDLYISKALPILNYTNTTTSKSWSTYVNGTSYAIVETGVAERMNFVAGGFVGIGYSTDLIGGNKLGVNGNSYFNGTGTFTDGTQGFKIGAYASGLGYGAIYPSTVTPGSSNYTLAATETNASLRANTAVALTIGGTDILNVASTGISVTGNGTFSGNILANGGAIISVPGSTLPVLVKASNAATAVNINGRSDNLGYIQWMQNDGATLEGSINGATGKLQYTSTLHEFTGNVTVTGSNSVTATAFHGLADNATKWNGDNNLGTQATPGSITNFFGYSPSLTGWVALTLTQAQTALGLGSNAYTSGGLMPVGSVIWKATATTPTGYLRCNGAAVSRTTFAALFAEIGTMYGAGDGSTTFNLPDTRGLFFRDLDSSAGIDPGRSVGTTQSDDIKSHYHIQGSESLYNDYGGGNLIGSDRDYSTSGVHNSYRNQYTSATGGTETRPKNIAFCAYIKY